ncbi:hypothetical protein Tco_1474536 [Tanacetum coccineum]
MKGRPLLVSCMLLPESLGSVMVPSVSLLSGKGCDLQMPSSDVDRNPVSVGCIFPFESLRSVVVPQGSVLWPEDTDCDVSVAFDGYLSWVNFMCHGSHDMLSVRVVQETISSKVILNYTSSPLNISQLIYSQSHEPTFTRQKVEFGMLNID